MASDGKWPVNKEISFSAVSGAFGHKTTPNIANYLASESKTENGPETALARCPALHSEGKFRHG
jgi:hypothetical protein